MKVKVRTCYNMMNRIISAVLCVLLLCGLLPVTVAAASPMVVLEFPAGILYEGNGYTVKATVVGGSGSYSYRWQPGYKEWGGSDMVWLDIEDNSRYSGVFTDTFTFTTHEDQGDSWDFIVFRCIATDSNGKKFYSSSFHIPTPAPKEELSVIIFYGLEQPTYGNAPDYTAESPAVNQYTPGEIQWYRTYEDIPANRMNASETVTEGQYCVRVYITPALSCKVSEAANCGLFDGEDRLLKDESGRFYVKGFCEVALPQSANILREPESVTVPRGQTATLRFSAQHVTAYQWQNLVDDYGWVDLTPEIVASLTNVSISGMTTNALTVQLPGYAKAVFRCKITSEDSSTVYTKAVATVFGGLTKIIDQPTEIAYQEGGTTEFSITGENFETASWVFFKNTTGYTLDTLKSAFPEMKCTQTIKADGTMVSLKLQNIPYDFNGMLCTCTVENTIGKTTSKQMVFKRYPEAPAILKQPEDRSVYLGQTYATMRVNASGEQLKFVWQTLLDDNWVDVSCLPAYFTGFDTDTLRFTKVTQEVLYYCRGFRCVVSNRSNELITETAKLLEVPAPKPCGGGSDCPGSAFKDMPKASDWAHSGVDFCLSHNLFSGVSATSFAPNGTMTRSMMVTVLWRLDGKPDPEGTVQFSDVAEGKWFSDAITWATENNIVSGVGDNRFNPEGNITREQMAVIFYRYADYRGYRTGAWKDMSEYSDAGKVHSFAEIGMGWAIAEGLISGVSAEGVITLNPLGSATRAQVASIIQRFCQNILGY